MKKVLSFVLVLALVLSSFSMAFAGSSTELKNLSDVAGNTNEEAIGVNYDLGIVTGNPDGTFQPEKAVTRAEFAAMITRALAIPQSALAGYANTNFKDANGYAWAVPYLAFCNSKGIMLGDGAGNAMPGKTITVNEAITMALRAIGYTANSSELTGVWPSNYVTKAQELKMYDDVAKDAAGVDKANAAQIVYNTLTVQKVAVNSDGQTDKLWADNHKDDNNNYDHPTTLLSAGLNCDAKENVVVGEYPIEDSVINIAKYIGQYGTIYINDDEEIVAFISDSDQLVGRFTEDDKFVATDGSKEYNLKSTTIEALSLDNAKTFESDETTSDVGTYGMGGDEYTINVDLSGKRINRIYSAVKWEVKAAEKISASDISDIDDDQKLLGYKFILDDNDNIDYTQFQLVGVKSVKDIKEDNVVYVYANNDKEIRKIEVGTEVVEGVVKSFKNSKSDTATTFAIGANKYKNAKEVVNGLDVISDCKTVTADDVAETVKATLDARGFIFEFDSTDSNDNFAVVIDKPSSTYSREVRVMLADGNEKVLKIEEKKDFNDLKKGVVFAYALNKDGEISSIDQNGGLNKFVKKDDDSIVTSASIGVVTNKVVKIKAETGSPIDASISSDVVVFTFDTTKDEYDVTTIDKVDKTTDNWITNAAVLFEEDDNKEVVAMIVDDVAATAGDKTYAVISDRDVDANADDEKVWQVVGFKDGADLNALTDDLFDELDNSNWATPDYNEATGFNSGVRLYEIKVDANGAVTSVDEFAVTVAEKNVVSADDRNSIVVVNKDVAVEDATDDNSTRYALSEDVVIYEVDDDEYLCNDNGSLKKGDFVSLYDTDEDEAGYEVVIFARP